MARTLGSYIAGRREELGIKTQTELARLTGLPRTTINRIETGTTQWPEADVRRRIAAALKVRHIDLMVAAGELTEDEIDDVAPLVGNDPDVDLIAESWPYLDRVRRKVILDVMRVLIEAPREDGPSVKDSAA